MKLLYTLPILIVCSLHAMQQPGRVPPLKALAAKKTTIKQPAAIPQDIVEYIELTNKALTFSGNAQTALWDMISQGTLLMSEQINFLKKRDPKLDLNHHYHPQNKFGATLLMHAAQLGNSRALRILLSSGARINEKSFHGWTALEYAARFGQLDTADLLISEGADLNIQDGFGRTALIQAVRHDKLEVAKLLIAAGANTQIADQEGQTALGYAKLSEDPRMVTLFNSTNKSASKGQ